MISLVNDFQQIQLCIVHQRGLMVKAESLINNDLYITGESEGCCIQQNLFTISQKQ